MLCLTINNRMEHLIRFPCHVGCDVAGVIAVRNFFRCGNRDAAQATNKIYMLPIRVINLFSAPKIQPLPGILSSWGACAVRANGASPMVGNIRRKTIAKNLQISLVVT